MASIALEAPQHALNRASPLSVQAPTEVAKLRCLKVKLVKYLPTADSDYVPTGKH